MPRIIVLIFSLFIVVSCAERKPDSHHGLSMFNRSQFSYKGLVDRSLKLKFKIDKNDVSKITAIIETDYDYNFPVNYEWKLGQFVTATDPQQLKGQLLQLEKNNPVEIQLSVKGFNSPENRFIRFEALGVNPQNRIFSDGIISSQIEYSFEKIVQEVENYKKSVGDK